MIKKTLNLLLILTTLIVGNTGCVNKNSTQATVSTKLLPTITEQKPTITTIKVVTNTPVPTTCQTKTVSIEDTPIPMKTWTPLPTIEASEINQTIHQMMVTNGNCKLPCWFGMNVGESSWSEAIYYLDSLGLKQYSYEEEIRLKEKWIVSQSIYYEYNDNGNYLNWSVEEIENKISQIGIGTNLIEQFGLSSLLENMGLPNEIYLNTAPDVPGYPQYESYLPFDLVLYYREANMLVHYFLEAQNDGTDIIACFDNQKILIYLWEPTLQPKDFEDYRFNVAGGGIEEGRENLKDIFSVTDFTSESFLEFYSNEENNCIQTPAEYWSVF